MSAAPHNTEKDQGFRWDLQVDDGGMPVHLPMGVTAEGHGPTGDNEAHHYLCWCGDPKCLLTRALREAWEAGVRLSPGTPGKDAAEPTFGDLAEQRRAEEDYYDGMGE